MPPCHAHPLPHMPPHHACPLPCMPPATCPPAMHAPHHHHHACPPYHASPLPHTLPPPCMPPHHAHPLPCTLPPATHTPPAMHAPHHAHPPVDRILDTRFWKYYLAPTSLRAVIMLFNLNFNFPDSVIKTIGHWIASYFISMLTLKKKIIMFQLNTPNLV